MVNQTVDFSQIIGLTLNRAYISKSFHSVLLRFSDTSTERQGQTTPLWFEMSHPPGIDEYIIFTHITNHQFLFDATVVSVDVVDSLDVTITTTGGTVIFNSQLVQPNFVNGILDIYTISNIQSYDDNNVVRMVAQAPNAKEVSYTVLSFDF